MRLALTAAFLLSTPAPALAQEAFEQGSIVPTFILGASMQGDDGTSIIVGGGLGYYVWDGLEVSFDVEHWFGSGNLVDITKIRPGLRYVLYQMPTLHPYAGVFYRHWFVHSDLLNDLDTVGAKLGVIFMLDYWLYIDVGATYEYALADCVIDCGTWAFPNVGLGVVF